MRPLLPTLRRGWRPPRMPSGVLLRSSVSSLFCSVRLSIFYIRFFISTCSLHFRRVLFIFDAFSSFSTLSLYFRRVRSIFDTCSPFLMRFLHFSRVLLTRPPHDVGWWVPVTPRFGGLPFLFVLTRPPHDVRWWVHATPRFDELPFALYFSPGHLTT